MESFVHLRKGRTPRRLHADLDGLKDDDLGRGRFTGRTANIHRRHDPTAYRSSGPLRPADVLSSELKPSDAADAHGAPLPLFSNADCQVSLSRRTEAMPFFMRYVDGDLLSFVHKGSGVLETEFAPLRYREGDWDEFAFVVHGTMADARWLDPAVDPNERTPGTCYLGDPEVVNNSPVGLARFCTLRSWLSQWSYDDANGDAVQCGPDIAVPTLVIGDRADDACTPSHTHRLYEAIGHSDKEMHEVPGANHYYAGTGQRDKLRAAVTVLTNWLHRRGFAQ